MAQVTVLWSGGFDSTALAYWHLEAGDDVSLLSVVLENNKEQGRAEAFARKHIGALLDEEFGRTIPRQEIKWPICNAGGFALPQPPIWLSAAVYNVSSGRISAGWVKGDDVWHHKADLMDLLSSLNKFRDNPLELVTPFEWQTKAELLGHYLARPLAFQLISSSQYGDPWAVGPENDSKCVEMRALAVKLKELLTVKTRTPGIGSLPRDLRSEEAQKLQASCEQLAKDTAAQAAIKNA